MMAQHKYKGYLIDARARLDSGGWKALFNNAKNVGNETHETPFQTEQIFDSEKVALQAAIWLAVQKIDSGYTPYFYV